jgi:hypothetical protein
MAGSAAAATLYVDQDGVEGSCDDGRSYGEAQSASTPLCTVGQALALAQAADEIAVRQGTYVPTAPIDLAVPDVTLRATAGEAVTLDLSAAGDVKGIQLRADGVAVVGFEVTGARQECIQGYATGANTIVRHNHVHHCGLALVDGKYQNCLDSDGDGMLIEGNVMHDSGSHVVYITGNDVTVRNNIVYRTTPPEDRGSYGIQVGTDGAAMVGVTIVHNAIGESQNRSGIVLYAPGGSIADITVANNVFWDNARHGMMAYDTVTYGGTNQIKNNVFAGNGLGDLDGVPASFEVDGNIILASSGEVGWRDLASYDLWPRSDSVLVDAALSGYADDDRVGTPRPQGAAPDIGAYEFLEGGGPPATGGSGGTAGSGAAGGANPDGGTSPGAAPTGSPDGEGGCGCHAAGKPSASLRWGAVWTMVLLCGRRRKER